MRVLMVGGTWTMSGGKPSGLVQKISDELKKYCEVVVHNGGPVAYLKMLLYYTKLFDVVLWWPDVPDDQILWDNTIPIEMQKDLMRNVKCQNPKCMLIGSKNNREGKYSFAQLITKTLKEKYNLCVEFYKQEDEIDPKGSLCYFMRLFDPLGNVWYDGASISKMVEALYYRTEFLSKITRVPTIQSHDNDWTNEDKDIPNQQFIQLIKQYAETFHELIHPENTERMLGNCSFRCQRGFPSYRGKHFIYVSQRNVDKRYIDETMFVPVRRNEEGQIEYLGMFKPSVDTPIQLRLYELFPKINYMIHSHCYIKGALATSTPIPCGGLEEVDEILNLFIDKNDDEEYNKQILSNVEGAKINLFGHGSLIMASNIQQLSNIEYVERTIPCLISLDKNLELV